MNGLMRAGGQWPPLQEKRYEGQPVVTLKDIDELHQRKDGTAWQNFNSNHRHFIEGVDFYHIKRDEIQNLKFSGFEIGKRGTLVFTQTGYLMIVKSFTDELSWAIQRELVNGYFARQKTGLSFMGTAVIPLKDAAAALGRSADALRHTLARNSEGLLGMGDCLLLEGKNLKRYREENNIRKMPGVTALWVVSAAGYEKLRKLCQR